MENELKENELNEKEYYKEKITDIINKIDETEKLMYLHRLISRIVKAGE